MWTNNHFRVLVAGKCISLGTPATNCRNNSPANIIAQDNVASIRLLVTFRKLLALAICMLTDVLDKCCNEMQELLGLTRGLAPVEVCCTLLATVREAPFEVGSEEVPRDVVRLVGHD
jgi:hypothetical protein